MIKKLSTKVLVYTTIIVLITMIVYTISSVLTIMALKKYSVTKVEKTFKENADENLEKEVTSYARILKENMDAKKSISFLFGEIIESAINKNDSNVLEDVYNKMNNILDLRLVAVFDSNSRLIDSFPKFEPTEVLGRYVKGLGKSNTISKVSYFDFHLNKDNSVSYTFVYCGRDSKRRPLYVAFDYNPYSVYSLIKTAQLEPYSQKYLWVINKRGVLIFDPPTKEHPLITLIDHVDLTDPKNGKELAYIVKNEILKGKTGIARYVFRGVDKFVGYTYIKELGWGLGLTLPTEIFYKPIKALSKDIDDRTMYTLALFGLISSLIILFTIVSTYLIAKKVVDPINRTYEAIEALLNGDYSKRLPDSDSEELSKLSKAVNKLIDFFEKNRNREDRR
ncbi:HAMP domain-containing protein [Hippea jasoniae]|uniref:HAMP domain-containing protein n=1 Tax=Hippea jasoniae TaxID=944479 RepID=UPI00054ED4F0|nr:HAMP domain-containing protein [Hippea jasoniae]